MAQIALAWIMQKDGVTAPIVGTTSLENLNDLLGKLPFPPYPPLLPPCLSLKFSLRCCQIEFDGGGSQVLGRAISVKGGYGTCVEDRVPRCCQSLLRITPITIHDFTTSHICTIVSIVICMALLMPLTARFTRGSVVEIDKEEIANHQFLMRYV